MTPPLNGNQGLKTTRDEIPARLAVLRAELRRLGLDGFIVPRADEHQGEYVAARSERLAWVCGFTGSAGLAVVLADKAAIFVDGRYTLQAEAEVPAPLFDHCPLADGPPTDWVAGNLTPGAKLGYDPWLLTPGQVTRYQAACDKAGAVLAPVQANPVDAVWSGRPEAPLSPIIIHDDAFAGETAADKRGEIPGILADGSLRLVVTNPGFDSRHDGLGDLILEGEDIPQLAVVVFRPDVVVRSGVNELCRSRELCFTAVATWSKVIPCRRRDSSETSIEIS